MAFSLVKPDVPTFRLRLGRSPILVSMPHIGTFVPSWLSPRLNPQAQLLKDTDWYLDRLYDFLIELDVTLIAATHSRYVIDLNRPPNNESLYPGQTVTGICPLESFDGEPLYLADRAPSESEVNERIKVFWRPYHEVLATELQKIKDIHGYAVLWDAHSICSKIPRLFEGELPHLNFGTADHQSCDELLVNSLVGVLRNQQDYSWVLNGRFKGGFITRFYGRPALGMHALQLEMAIRTYMLETSIPSFDDAYAKPVKLLLHRLFETALRWKPSYISKGS